MIAWSLSGGGNRGPIQVGAIRALFEAGIRPDFLVGTSAGALNAAFLATDPTPKGIDRLEQIWKNTTRADIFPEGWFTRVIRFITGADSLNSGDAVQKYIQKNIPPGIETFGDLKLKVYLTTADLDDAQLYLYGDDPTAPIVEAARASVALPIQWPPVMIGGRQFVDGGIVANVPISVAIDKGADTIYALDLETTQPSTPVHGVYPIALRALGVMLYQQLLHDIERAIQSGKVTLHHIYLGDILSGISNEDFTHAAEMIDQGYQRTKDYLAHPTPNQLALPVRTAVTARSAPPGAAPYKPSF
jgi:NTE family protein